MIESVDHLPGPEQRATLAILAGGEGSRMGRPKADLQVHGGPLLSYLHRRFAWSGPTLLVTAPGRERPSGGEAFDCEVTDPLAGAGPLRGILTALEHATTPLLLVAAVDMPRVAQAHLQWLLDRLESRVDLAGLFLRRGELLEPLPCAFRVDRAIPHARAALDAGRRSIRSLLEAPGFATVGAPAEWDATGVWTNVNDPPAWDAFVRDAMPLAP
jgi:molybdopterin-guanine dinucleotide biosynthesis protein A